MSYKVELFIYDLSQGMATMISPLIIGKRIDGVWHTSIVVYEREYFFSSTGVESCVPGTTALGPPLQKLQLGITEIPYSVFIDYLNELSHSSFESTKYELLKNNCNSFSEELAQFLCGAHIPKYILDLPNEVLQTKLGPTLEKLVCQLEQSARPLADEQNLTFQRNNSSSSSLQQNKQEGSRSADNSKNDGKNAK